MACLQKAILYILLFCSCPSFAQYILNGSAQKNTCNCYTLTTNTTFQSGSVWNSNKIDLRQSFDFAFNVNLGCDDAGADGIVFILQPISTSIGSSGEGMGFSGIAPSIGIALDTYQNPNWNDPSYDHISIQANGNINHLNDLAGPVAISAASNNVEDCQWHKLRIAWDAGGKWLRTYFDGVARLEKNINLINDIFNGNSSVYWGFTGATGGSVNLQQFCTALDPDFKTTSPNNITCEGGTLGFTDLSQSFAPIENFTWSFGDGSTATAQSPLAHTYTKAGTYPVSLKIIAKDGCENTITKNVTAAAIPRAEFSIYDTCHSFVPRYEGRLADTGVDYHWNLDGADFPLHVFPDLKTLSSGSHALTGVVSSPYGCGPASGLKQIFTILPVPQVTAKGEDGCAGLNVSLNGMQTDNQTSISQWLWNLGDNTTASGQTVIHRYSNTGNYTAQLIAKASNGCSSKPETIPLFINKAFVSAGNDTILIRDKPALLAARGNGSFSWSPASGLSDAAVANPVVILSADQSYAVTVTTAEGCTATDNILIKVIRGPAVYVPNAFTPNGDGRNDILKPVYVGISSLKRFAVFNRWGQKMFESSSLGGGWDGGLLSGTFVWMVDAEDESGHAVFQKGTVTIIR